MMKQFETIPWCLPIQPTFVPPGSGTPGAIQPLVAPASSTELPALCGDLGHFSTEMGIEKEKFKEQV